MWMVPHSHSVAPPLPVDYSCILNCPNLIADWLWWVPVEPSASLLCQNLSFLPLRWQDLLPTAQYVCNVKCIRPSTFSRFVLYIKCWQVLTEKWLHILRTCYHCLVQSGGQKLSMSLFVLEHTCSTLPGSCRVKYWSIMHTVYVSVCCPLP